MSYLLTNWAIKSLMFMAAIGFAGLLVSFRIILDLRDMPHIDPNVGEE